MRNPAVPSSSTPTMEVAGKAEKFVMEVAGEAEQFVMEAISKLKNQANHVHTAAQISQLQGGLGTLSTMKKEVTFPPSPTKTHASFSLRAPEKKKRAFMYLALQFLDGGIWCPFVKLGYISIEIEKEFLDELRKPLKRYETYFNDMFFYFVPIANFVKVVFTFE